MVSESGALSAEVMAAWRSRVAVLAGLVGVSCPTVDFVDGGPVTGAHYRPLSDRLEIRRSWIAALDGDPASEGDPASPAATALLVHELGHKIDRGSLFLLWTWSAVVALGAWGSLLLLPPGGGALMVALWFGGLLSWLIVGTFLWVALSHRAEVRADDHAADAAGLAAMVAWFGVAPSSGAIGLVHPSDAARIKRQERRLGRDAASVRFEALIRKASAGPVRRLSMCWREFAAAWWGLGRRPFAPDKRAKSVRLLIAVAAFVGLSSLLGSAWTVALVTGFVLFLVVGWPVGFVFASGHRVESADGCSSLRVVARRSVPGVFEVCSFSRWPMTEATKGSSDEVAGDVKAWADECGVTLLALAASEGLRQNYIRKFGFSEAPEGLCVRMSGWSVRRYLVRAPESVIEQATSAD